MGIIFTGGSGTLGTEFKKLNSNILYPSSAVFNILDIAQCREYIKNNFPIKSIIHAAAFTNVKESEKEIIRSIDTNIIGTINLIKLCYENNIKLIYISTDYVFDGNKGNYKTNDPINPLSKYAKSKAAAELAVRMYDNSLVIRTSFFGLNFPYEAAFVDQWSSKDYVDVMAPKILEACLNNEIGIRHIFSKRETIFEKAKKRKSDVKKISICDINLQIPKDTSLVES